MVWPPPLSQVRWDEAFKQIEKAVELDPFSQMINFNHSYYYYRKRDYRKALELVKKAAELDPNNIEAHLRLLNVYGKMGMLDEAKHEAEVAVGIAKELYPAMLPSIEAMIAYHEDDKEGARRLLPELEARTGEPAGPEALEIAELYFYLGEINKGFDWLEKSYQRRDYFLNFIKTDEFLDRAREDPRYQNLLKRIGLG
jgi:tetratricopeptide (TPR) repeat protein